MINPGKSGQACDKLAPGGGAEEGSWQDQPLAAHHDHLYIHPKHSTKICTYSFFAVNLHPCHHLSLSECIKNIVPSVKMGKTILFWNYEAPYYKIIASVW